MVCLGHKDMVKELRRFQAVLGDRLQEVRAILVVSTRASF